MLRKVFMAFGISVALVLALCGDALASEGGDGGGHAFEYGGEEWTKVIWTGLAPENIANPLGTKHTGYCVRAWNNLDATACAIGRDHNAPDLVARYKLSNAETGGRFYELSLKFRTNGVQYPPWFAATWLLDADYKTYGIDYAQYIYWAYPVEEEELEGARQDFDTVVNGGDLGGGGASGNLPELGVGNWLPRIMGDFPRPKKFCVNLGNDAVNYLTTNVMNTHPFYYIGVSMGYNNNTSRAWRLFLAFCDKPFTFTNTGPVLNMVAETGGTFKYYTTDSTTNYGQGYLFTVNNLTGMSTANGTLSWDFKGSSNVTSVESYGYLDVGGSGGGGGTVPDPDEPNPWPPTPDPDPTPDPPDVPTVPTDPVYDGDTYINNDYTWITTNYYENDYSDVLAGIQEILDAMDSHCIHLQNAIGNAVNNLSNNITNGLNNLANNVNGALNSEFMALKDYLRQLFQWLAEQFAYSFGPRGIFDDTSIINWLRRIYVVLLRLVPTTPTPNPVDDPTGFWDWLLQQFAEWFADLTGNKVGQVGSLFQSLKDFFPFSIPWDLAFMLGLLVAQPVTPVFDLPIPVGRYVNANQKIMVHVDCTGWDGAAAVCRIVMYFLFCYALAQKVPDWFNTIKVGDNW